MKKRIFALCIAIFTVVMTLVVNAESEYYRLQDMAEPTLLSESENAEILAKLDLASESNGVDFVILTVNEPEEGLTPEQDATEWYEYMGFDTDGVMLYVAIDTRDWYFLTSGFCINAINDAGIDYIAGEFLDYLSDGDYAAAFETFISLSEKYIVKAKTGEPYTEAEVPKEPYDFPMSLVVSVGVGLLASIIITSIWKGQLKSVANNTRAADYMKPGSLNIESSRDFFLYRTISRTAKPQESSGGGSSTHRSSSGRSYGGSGGKF